jgi:formylglycine-generating enzyme required for sulfatase activity
MDEVRTKGKRVALTAGAVALVVLALAIVLGWPRIHSWYRFTQVFEGLGRNAQGYPEYRHRQTGIVMVRLPGGKFWMGAQSKDPKGKNYDPEAKDNEAPVHEVTLSPFLIGKYEVTQGQWKAVMELNPSSFKGYDDDIPVLNVSLYGIQRFIAETRLSLPTEAEWKYACWGGATIPNDGTRAPNGFGLYDLGNVWEWWCDGGDSARIEERLGVFGFRPAWRWP